MGYVVLLLLVVFLDLNPFLIFRFFYTHMLHIIATMFVHAQEAMRTYIFQGINFSKK